MASLRAASRVLCESEPASAIAMPPSPRAECGMANGEQARVAAAFQLPRRSSFHRNERFSALQPLWNLIYVCRYGEAVSVETKKGARAAAPDEWRRL